MRRIMGKVKKKVIIIVFAVVTAFTSIFMVVGDKDDFKIIKNLDIYFTLFRELNLYYVDQTDPEKLIKSSIDAMLASLDPYTVFIPESELDDFKFMTSGEYGGIGAYIRKSGEFVQITEPYENFPAAKAGLKAGDLIIAIDGKSIKGKDVSMVSSLLKGSPNSQIEISVKRENTINYITKTLIRQTIKIDNVSYFGMLNKETGYIRLTNFTTGAASEVKNALHELKEIYKAKSLIIDIRNNPGGILNESVDIANLFLPKGQEVVNTIGKVKQWNKKYLTQNEPVDLNLPVVILTNRGSASASEIVAGSLQDLDRAVIVGQRTFGKGLVQTTRPLSYNTELKVTTAKYYIPSGRCIQALDYAHRNEDGSVGNVPDSLISEFSTKNGRKVYNGGGIIPDIEVTPENFSQLSLNLYTSNMMFNFATLYYQQHDSLPLVNGRFLLSDHDFEAFVRHLRENHFDYQTKTESQLQQLKVIAKQEKYFEHSQKEFESLEIAVGHNITKDLESHKEEVKELLEEEIISRYYYQKGRIKQSLNYDDQLKKALEIITDTNIYESILKGTYKGGNIQIISRKQLNK
jgi:carboxyl-terminal processing protease